RHDSKCHLTLRSPSRPASPALPADVHCWGAGASRCLSHLARYRSDRFPAHLFRESEGQPKGSRQQALPSFFASLPPKPKHCYAEHMCSTQPVLTLSPKPARVNPYLWTSKGLLGGI